MCERDREDGRNGRQVELLFSSHLRPERRFPGVDELRKQIAADVVEARRLLEQC